MTVNPTLEGLEVIAAEKNPCWQGVPPHGRPIEEGGLVERRCNNKLREKYKNTLNRLYIDFYSF